MRSKGKAKLNNKVRQEKKKLKIVHKNQNWHTLANTSGITSVTPVTFALEGTRQVGTVELTTVGSSCTLVDI